MSTPRYPNPTLPRITALCLASVVTLILLGSMDVLAARDTVAAHQQARDAAHSQQLLRSATPAPALKADGTGAQSCG